MKFQIFTRAANNNVILNDEVVPQCVLRIGALPFRELG